MESILIFILVIVAIAVIALVLLQHGKGADVGAAFGSGASNTMFGSQGSTSFLMKLTIGLAAIFFIICIILTNMASHAARDSAVMIPASPVQSSSNVPAPTAPDNSNVPQVPQK